MRKQQKKQVEDFVKLLGEAHSEIRNYLQNQNVLEALKLLEECQQETIRLGTWIEEAEGKDFATVHVLEEYCELLYLLYEEIAQGQAVDAKEVYESLHRGRVQIENSLRNDIVARKEVVFLPYKASMWDSMESIWKAAKEDEACDAYVIPIPYYDKNPDGSFREMHYEGDKYPEDVPITDYRAYNFETRIPDIIFFHNPYDNFNRVTSVHPYFFSENLKKYTNKLVYIPYYVVPWSIPEHFVLSPGVIFADIVFVQSEQIRKQYIKYLEKELYQGKAALLEKKIIALGSPKTDKIRLSKENRPKMPEAWKQKIGNKKTVFFNTNVSLLLNNSEYFTENLSRIFRIFNEYKNKFMVIWREHPLTMETLHSMRPGLLEDYLNLREEFKRREWGILDETEEPHLAMAVSDCYFGAGGSLVTIYSVTGKPMMITAYDYPGEISKDKISKEDFYNSLGGRTYYKEKNVNALNVFLENYEEIADMKEHRLQVISRHLDNLDGTVGTKIYEYVTGGC